MTAIGGHGSHEVIDDRAQMVDRSGFERAEREQRSRWALQVWDGGNDSPVPSASCYWVMPEGVE